MLKSARAVSCLYQTENIKLLWEHAFIEPSRASICSAESTLRNCFQPILLRNPMHKDFVFSCFLCLLLEASHCPDCAVWSVSTRLIDKSFGRKMEPSGFTRNSTGNLEWFSIDSARRFRQPFHRLSNPWEHPRYVNNHCRGLS